MQLLHKDEFFPWGGLPYPVEHAKLGYDLIEKGEIEVAQKMVAFQQATLDHQTRPLFAFFRQEQGGSFSELEKANQIFFDAIGVCPSPNYHFVDPDLGVLVERDHNRTIACLGSGCKSGMGAYLIGESGVINFGPQLLSVDDCRGFGLAGRGKKIEITDHLLHYQCRLAAPHSQKTGIFGLEDSGYSGVWITSTCEIEDKALKIQAVLEGSNTLSDFLFTFFVKADHALVARLHKLHPRSLDRYQGPVQAISFNEVTLYPEEGFKSMEVIPLAGNEEYWGADFLVALKLDHAQFRFSLRPTRLG